MNLDTIMAELAQYIRMQEEAAAMVESLKDQLKERMTAAGVESLAGSEHKATYKTVTSSRVDTTALKKELPEIAARYTKTTTSRRFTVAGPAPAGVLHSDPGGTATENYRRQEHGGNQDTALERQRLRSGLEQRLLYRRGATLQRGYGHIYRRQC